MEEPSNFPPWARQGASILGTLHSGGLKSSTNYMACIIFGFALLSVSVGIDLNPLGAALEISGFVLIVGGITTWIWFLVNLARKADA